MTKALRWEQARGWDRLCFYGWSGRRLVAQVASMDGITWRAFVHFHLVDERRHASAAEAQQVAEEAHALACRRERPAGGRWRGRS